MKVLNKYPLGDGRFKALVDLGTEQVVYIADPSDPYRDQAICELIDAHAVTGPLPASPAPPDMSFTYKTDIWRRMTDAEAETFTTALAAAPAKLRGLWNDCLTLERSAPEFATFQADMAARFGAARAAAILAPSI